MLRIRFQRVGAKSQPAYRIVVIDQRQKRSGDVIENIGFHNPRTRPGTDNVNAERALYWLSVGAQPTDAAKGVLRRTGTWALFERLQKGESLETLSAEAASASASADQVSPKTSYPAPVTKAPAAEAAEAEEVAVEAAETPEAVEAEAVEAAEAVETPEAAEVAETSEAEASEVADAEEAAEAAEEE